MLAFPDKPGRPKKCSSTTRYGTVSFKSHCQAVQTRKRDTRPTFIEAFAKIYSRIEHWFQSFHLNAFHASVASQICSQIALKHHLDGGLFAPSLSTGSRCAQ